MAEAAVANAFPRKHFFLEMFTRDISLEDCILDLIDNSIDSLVRREHFDPAKDILRKRPQVRTARNLPVIRLHLDTREISIEDNCGGIPLDLLNEVFTFGHDPSAQLGQLGAYGIGLKRAIFKIGEEFTFDSKTADGGFSTRMDVAKWAERDSSMDDWTIPVFLTGPARKPIEAGTQIRFIRLRDEVKMRLRDGAFLGRLTHAIALTYALFLQDSVRVTVDDKTVEPIEIPIGTSEHLRPGQVEFSRGDVKVRIIASLAARQPEWAYERAGWYVLCNGRVVLGADKSDLTGWGDGLPRFHSKYNGFIGVAVFRSKNPLALPWTTTKRGLHVESPVYQVAKVEMAKLARPVISFLNDMYKTELVEEPAERSIAEKVDQTDIREVVSRRPTPFTAVKRQTAAKTTVRVQYDAEIADIERVKKVLRQPKWSANKVGKYTFHHYLRTEAPK